MAGAPSGTVTLLFTDIEGSTRLWERDRDAMAKALDRHNALLAEAIEDAGGYVFKTVGDAFCAVFAEAPEALAAAVAAQRALAAEPWPEAIPMRVRMALHSGGCVRRGDDYFGPPVNRVARLVAVGHGGQVLVSAATHELVADRPAEGTSLRDLGEHRLKDLGRPERIYQVCIAGLQETFDPLATLDNPEVAHNLPVQASSFVGRDRELAELSAAVRTPAWRLVTLTGAGGVGKTRLALQVAAEMVDEVAEGVWLAELAPLADPDLVARTVASLLEVSEEPGRPLLDTLVGAIGSRHLLIVLDNCEHVLGAAAKLADTALRACARLQLLATSREPLAVDGEHVYRVPSMSVPSGDALGPEQVADYEAVQLLVERGSAQRHGFALDEANAVEVAKLCTRLDGIPLAIELAAARLRSLSVADINARLDQRFRLLTAGMRQAPARHQTLRALIDWSYDLLNAEEELVLDRLSVFAGGFTLEAAEAVAGRDGIDDWEVLGLLGGLVDKSVVQADDRDGTTRYRLLETVRHYASERLAARGEDEVNAARWAHREHYLALAETAEPELRGPDQAEWLIRLEPEHDNLTAALVYSSTCPASDDRGLRLAVALDRFWQARGRLKEGADVIQRLLDTSTKTASPVRGRALVALAWFLGGLDKHASRECAEQALSEAHALDDGALEARALARLVALRFEAGLNSETADQAEAMATRAVELARMNSDHEVLSHSLAARASERATRGDLRSSSADLHESVTGCRAAGDESLVGQTLMNLGIIDVASGDIASARAHLNEATVIAQRLSNQNLLTYCWNMLGWAAVMNREAGEARQRFIDALTNARRFGLNHPLVISLIGLGVTASAAGDPPLASALFGVVDHVIERHHLPGIDAFETFIRNHHEAQLRQTMGQAEFAAAYQRGRGLADEEAIALALTHGDAATSQDTPMTVTQPRAAAPTAAVLSAREKEIVSLLAEGATDAQIAERLYLSVNTVRSHLDRVRDKTGLRRRAELARLGSPVP